MPRDGIKRVGYCKKIGTDGIDELSNGFLIDVAEEGSELHDGTVEDNEA